MRTVPAGGQPAARSSASRHRIAAGILSGVASGRALSRIGLGRLLTLGAALYVVGLAIYCVAPSLWMMLGGTALLGAGFGAIDCGLNTFAVDRFDAREVIWMHACHGVGAMVGPCWRPSS
ncbi:MAG TPA: hypothetical protein VIA06_10900 [Candidatus Dormibacteraeota bacterium]|nr:hypothetical protein [Candidatus Dormibacteraeota bacterium]